MKFTIKRNEFLKGVTSASRFVPSSATNPILLNLVLMINETGLVLYGGNGDVYLQTVIPFEALQRLKMTIIQNIR